MGLERRILGLPTVHGLGAKDLARGHVIHHGRHVDVAHGRLVVAAQVAVAFESSLSSGARSCGLTFLSIDSGTSCMLISLYV
jgi:hypothetical protein